MEDNADNQYFIGIAWMERKQLAGLHIVTEWATHQ